MKRVHLRLRDTTFVTWAESNTKSNVEYEIARKEDGNLACACMGFVFSKRTPKACAHIDAYVETGGMWTGTRGEQVESVTMQQADVTFTFRRPRAMSL